MVTCEYVPTKKVGHSKKFDCSIDGKDVIKVRDGDDNGEVQGSVLASRLLWSLGFVADRVYPAHVVCRGCSSYPWNQEKRTDGEQTFDPAAIERKPEGHVMKTVDDKIPAGRGRSSRWRTAGRKAGATLAQRDALTLLAVMIQHTDSKPEQQRLVCLPGGVNAEGLGATSPFSRCTTWGPHSVTATCGTSRGDARVAITPHGVRDHSAKFTLPRSAFHRLPCPNVRPVSCTARNGLYTSLVVDATGQAQQPLLLRLAVGVLDHDRQQRERVALRDGRAAPRLSPPAPSYEVHDQPESYVL